jgi:hypothetical protein
MLDVGTPIKSCKFPELTGNIKHHEYHESLKILNSTCVAGWMHGLVKQPL